MVNIFGMKFFESPSMEEQMHETGRRNHGPNCECPICAKKRYISRRHRSRRYRSKRSFRGGYIYNDKNMKEDDITMELSTSKSISKTKSKGKNKSASAKGTRRRRH
jgi:hypothetical protein